MRNWTIGAFALILFAGSIMSCSDLVEPVDFDSHPPGWADENDDNFHGDFVLESPGKTASCATCHGTTFEGEVTGISCSSEGCHSVYPHPEGFASPTNPTHRETVAALNWDLRLCRDCHGPNLDGIDDTYPEKNCSTAGCHTVYPHPADFASPSNPTHRTVVAELNWDLSLCRNCHGPNLDGDNNTIPEKNCSTAGCHRVYPHPADFANPTNPTHREAVAELNWDLSLCRDCHGQNYDGNGNAYPEKNCLTCHTQDQGPEACNTCHGSDDNIAPPGDLSGNTSTDFAGVGAHQTHLATSDLTDILTDDLTPACSHCHATVDSFSDVNHIDFGPAAAELVFSSFATRDGSLLTSYDPATATCSNVYCHGSFEFLKSESSSPFVYTGESMLGNDLVIGWTEVGVDKAACGTCHGLPPTGHAPFPTCSSCHPRVVDSALNIIGTDLHINGEIDLF